MVFDILAAINKERNTAAASETSHYHTRNPGHATCDEFNLRDQYADILPVYESLRLFDPGVCN